METNELLKYLFNNKVDANFKRFHRGNLYYRFRVVENRGENLEGSYSNCVDYEFPVPASDTGDGIFGELEKASLLMRYVRKAITDGELKLVARYTL